MHLNLLCTKTTRIHDIYHPCFLLHLYSSTCMGIGLQRDDAKCVKICCWVTCVLPVTIKDVLQAFEKPENKTRMYEIRQEAGGDLVKLLQYQLLFAASVQQEVIKQHGFSDNGEGTNPCLNHLSINSLWIVDLRLRETEKNLTKIKWDIIYDTLYYSPSISINFVRE